MDQNMMALLAAVLSGQSKPLSGQQPQMAAPMPMRPQMPMQGQQPFQMPATSVRPMGANEQHDTGRPGTGVTPGVDQGLDDGSGNGGGGDGKGGRSGNNHRLSQFERQMRAIANKGPRAYTPAIKKNLGIKGPNTPGYGKADPSTFRTGMADSLAGVLTGTPDQSQVADKLPSWI